VRKISEARPSWGSARRSTRPRVVRLAASGREEGGPVERHAVRLGVGGDHFGVELAQIGVVEVDELRHGLLDKDGS
jgi:hypothetical protein